MKLESKNYSAYIISACIIYCLAVIVSLVIFSGADEHKEVTDNNIKKIAAEDTAVIESGNTEQIYVGENLTVEPSRTIMEADTSRGSYSRKSELIRIENTDISYNGATVWLSKEDRNKIEKLVYKESHYDFIGSAIVAQCIRDYMVENDVYDIDIVIDALQYAGNLDQEPTEEVKKAVRFIFDQGGYAVKHKILYFYAPQYCTSDWHESQEFVVEYGGHRVFDRW